MYYVYIWFIKSNNEVFYVGKGIGDRFKCKKKTERNPYFLNICNKYECDSEILKYFKYEREALEYEKKLIEEYKSKGMAKANFHEGGLGGDVWKYAPENKKQEFIEKMKVINKERCNTEEFKTNASVRTKKRYECKNERKKHSDKLKEVWNDEELRNKHSDIIKKSYTKELREVRAKALEKEIALELNNTVETFKSRKSMLEYLSKKYDFRPSNQTLAKLLKGETYKAFREKQKKLDGMKIYYIEKGVTTIENLPE